MRKTIILLFLVPAVLFSQRKDPLRDSRKHFFWGVAFSATNARMKIKPNMDFFLNNNIELLTVKPIAQAGGGFGGTVAYRFYKFWELKAQTMLHLHERNIEYTFKTLPKQRVKIESITFDIPLCLKFRSEMPRNTRFYVLGGVRYSNDFQSNEKLNIGPTRALVAFKRTNWYYEYGAGFEFRLDFVDMALEARMSNSMTNALVSINGSNYSGSMNAIFPRLFQISILAQN